MFCVFFKLEGLFSEVGHDFAVLVADGGEDADGFDFNGNFGFLGKCQPHCAEQRHGQDDAQFRARAQCARHTIRA